MALSMKPSHVRRYKDILRLLTRYGSTDLFNGADLDEEILLEDLPVRPDQNGAAEALADDLEALGPTFVKLGQLLSTRADLLPAAYLRALARLQDDVEPFDAEEVQEIIADELHVRISKAFRDFDPEPMAAASLGQVHRAVLRDGRPVAVKVQRPDIRERVREDLETLEEIADFADKHTEAGRKYALADVLAQFRKTLLRELDYRQEAQNLKTLGRNLREFDRIFVPQPIDDYTTSRVLTMEYVRGRKVTDVSPVALVEIDGRELAEQLSKAYLDQILVDGFVHADPHPGNIFITDDHRLGLLDLGMVTRVEPTTRDRLLRLLLAVVESEGADAAEIARELGTTTETFDEQRYRREIADLVLRYQHATLEEINVGRIVVEIARISGDCGVRPAPELTMLGKTLLNLDEVSRTLAPDFDPNRSIREYADSLMRKRMLKRLSPGNVLASIMEVNELVQEMPGRINTVLRRLADNQFEVQVNSIDEVRLIHNLHKIGNRLSLSLVLAALIVGAAMLMRVDTEFTILGYPGIAMILFLVAAAFGFALVISILFGEDRSASRSGRS